MEKTNLTIEDFEDKKTKDGKRYTRFKTDDGWMSCFDKEVISKLKENEGKVVCVGINMDAEKKFKNIRELHGDADADVETETKTETKKPAFSQTSMYVSYAKDIFCALKDKSGSMADESIMNNAVNLVKQAKESF